METLTRRLGFVALSLFALANLGACTRPQPAQPTAVSHGGSISDHVSFIDHLRGRGLTVGIIGDVQRPFLRATGTRVRLDGGPLTQPVELQSYSYDDTASGTNGARAAEADAEQIGPNGTPKTTVVTWSGAPHWFRKERVIVLYVGSDQVVLTLLTELLGPQFAGQ